MFIKLFCPHICWLTQDAHSEEGYRFWSHAFWIHIPVLLLTAKSLQANNSICCASVSALATSQCQGDHEIS